LPFPAEKMLFVPRIPPRVAPDPRGCPQSHFFLLLLWIV
jgi:hypothetical protein